MAPGGAAGRALPPHPVLRLALPVLRLRRPRRRRGARARRHGSTRSSRRSTSSSISAPTRSTPRSRPDRPPLESVYLGGGTPSLLPADGDRRVCSTGSAPGSASPTAPRSPLEANPGPDERGDAAALRAAGVTRLSIGAQSMSAAGLRRLGRRHRVVDVVRAVAEARAAGIGSVSLDLLYDAPDATLRRLDRDARRGARPRARPPVAVRPDPRRPGCRRADRPGRRPPARRRRGARRWRATAPAAPGRGPGRRGVPPRRPPPGRRRLARLRDQQLGAAGPREPPQPRVLAAPAVRGGRARAPTRSTARPGAGTPPASTATWRALTPPDRRPRRGCRPAARRPLDAATAAAEAVILGLRTDRGVPIAAAHRPPLADQFGWALAAELLDVTADDRVVLTTRGRLLSNELFARLV